MAPLNAFRNQKQGLASDVPLVAGNAWNSLLAHAFTMNMDFASSLPLSWETGTMHDIFNDDVLPAFNPTVLEDTTDLSQLDVSNPSAASEVMPCGGDETVKPAYMSAVRSLRHVDYVESKRAQLTLASSMWMEILSIDWRASSVGEQISMDLQAEPSGDLAEQSLQAVFGVKSPSYSPCFLRRSKVPFGSPKRLKTCPKGFRETQAIAAVCNASSAKPWPPLKLQPLWQL